jgi:Leucine-rich repeat (LRR) protein
MILTKQYIQQHIKDKNIDITKPFILYLSHCNITSIEVDAFDDDNLINLIGLYLSSNQLSSLPAGVFDNLINLEDLDLSNNQIKGIDNTHYSNTTKILELIKKLKTFNNEVKNVDNTIDGNTTLNDIKNNINQHKEKIIQDIINFLQK